MLSEVVHGWYSYSDHVVTSAPCTAAKNAYKAGEFTFRVFGELLEQVSGNLVLIL